MGRGTPFRLRVRVTLPVAAATCPQKKSWGADLKGGWPCSCLLELMQSMCATLGHISQHIICKHFRKRLNYPNKFSTSAQMLCAPLLDVIRGTSLNAGRSSRPCSCVFQSRLRAGAYMFWMHPFVLFLVRTCMSILAVVIHAE